jgi:hypothetical protein
MISEIRSYIKTQIKVCNPDYKEIRDPFASDDIVLSQIDNHYKLVIGGDSPFLDGNYYGDVIDCTLELYAKAAYDEIETHDALYDLALNVKNEIINPVIVKNSDHFSDIEFITLQPEALISNDKVFKLVLTFQVRRDFDYRSQ